MEHYRQDLSIKASPATVYAALSTIAGLRGWWTQDCDGASGVGETLHFRFGSCAKDMRVTRLAAGRAVQWRCTRSHIEAPSIQRHDEWTGTEPSFTLSDDGQGGTALHFEHIGLTAALECYTLCQQGWQHFLGSLRQYAETGAGTPYIPERRAAA
ncbi:SRPBCC domain-containing protein [Pseudoduganella sp.]|uniref:SRPBCC family protein n=1 Tax=Pseudoduganella sp. TaxID=1880898 RepID=UPI0035B26323